MKRTSRTLDRRGRYAARELRWSSARKRRWLVVVKLALFAIGAALASLPFQVDDRQPPAEQRAPAAARPPTPAHIDVRVTLDRTRAEGVSQMAVGATHVQHSLDPWGDQAAVERGRALLQQAAVYQNQHIMGFGAPNPEPSPGEYDWSGLDQRVQLMRDTGGIPTITLCCAPDWMKGGDAGATDWSTLEEAPLPRYYDDFAELARQVALRYPDVRHYLVWNEMKGFWNPERNNWDYVAYTKLYNRVYDALKSVDRQIKVGGPYLVIEGTGTGSGEWWSMRPIVDRNREVLQYWLDHKHGADFLVVDRAVKGPHDTNDYTAAKYLSLTPLFGDVTRQLRSISHLPIWWAESYFASDAENRAFEAAGLASMLYHQLKAGAAVSLRWAPQVQPDGDTGQNLFTDTLVAGGGQPLPAFYVYQAFRDHFGPGTRLYHAPSSSRDVEALASATKVLLINKRPTPLTVGLGDTAVELKGYEVRVLSL